MERIGIAMREAAKALLAMPCLFRFFTGLYCPGCGGTRAVLALLSGDLKASIYYHPFVPYAALALLVEAVFWGGSRLGLWKNDGFFRRYRLWTIGALVIVAVNWLVKNYVLKARGIALI